MLITNKHTKGQQAVNVGDILYAYYDEPVKVKGYRNRLRTWTFRCQGLLVKKDDVYIMGPGDVLYQLGVDCFTSDVEARSVGYFKDGRSKDKGKPGKQFRLVELTDEERMRI